MKVQTNGFDADSEGSGSDCELMAKTSNMIEERSANSSKCKNFELKIYREIALNFILTTILNSI